MVLEAEGNNSIGTVQAAGRNAYVGTSLGWSCVIIHYPICILFLMWLQGKVS